jgi:hypothetical protein
MDQVTAEDAQEKSILWVPRQAPIWKALMPLAGYPAGDSELLLAQDGT